MTLKVEIDLRAPLGPARNQGRRPTCLAFAASDAHRYAHRHPELLSVEWLFYHVARHAGTGPQVGTTIPDTRRVLQAIGQPEEAIWPYSPTPPNGTAWRPPVNSPPVWTCGSRGCDTSLAALRSSIEAGIPVIIGVYVSDTFNLPHSWAWAGDEAILDTDDGHPIDQSRGHALVVVGSGHYNREPVVLVRNSWGPRWGHNGHAWVRQRYLELRLTGAFIVSKGAEDVQSDGSEADAYAGARLG